MIRCTGDNNFGPVLEPGLVTDCYNFDFTLVFEESIFSIAPCAIALLNAAFRLYRLSKRQTVVQWPLLRAFKLAFWTIQSILQLALVVLWGTGHGVVTRTTLASSILAFVTSLALLVLSDFEHRRSVRPSIVIQLFLVSTILLDLPRVRTQWLLDDNATVAAVFTVTFVLQVALLCLESVQKWHKSISPDQIPPEMRQGLLGTIFFSWLNPLFMKGYSSDLDMKDLYAIDDNLKGTILYERLLNSWNKVNRDKKHCLTTAVFRTFAPELTLAIIPRLAFVGFSLAQPYLINNTLLYITFHQRLPDYYGYGLIGAWALCYIGIALTTRGWMHIAFRTMTKIRGALVTTIYKNMLTVRAETGNSSAALSLMSTDVDRITMTALFMVLIIPDIIQLALALWILGTQLGAVSVAPIVLCIICGGIAARIAKLIPPRQRKWMAAIQKRVGITSDIIQSIKGVKVAGLSAKAEKQIEGLRDYELDQSTQFRKIQISSLLLGITPSLLMPAVTFTVYAIAQHVSGGNQFGVAQAFTSLSLLNVLIMPIMDLTTAWANVSQALACLDRIQAFLLKEKRKDYRTLVSDSDAGSSTTAAPNTDEDDAEKPKTEQPWIKVRGGNFGWKKDAPAIIKDVDIDIMPGQLTLIVGPVASGKSTLLKALLGEAIMLSGSVELTIPEEIAYCDQDAWLLNQTVKENILAFEEYNKEFYDSVIQACQLTEDLEQLPSGDDTLIGSKGVSLSGGQKQRVVLARAVYNRKPIVILDDILKGLDADTYSKCFAAILGPEGLLRRSRRAVILATHNIQLLPHAEHIIVLNDDGHITEKGSFDQLNSSAGGYVSGLGLKKSAVQEAEAVVVEEEEEEQTEKEAMLAKIASIKAAQKEKAAGKGEGALRGKRNADAMFAYIGSMGRLQFPLFCVLTVLNIGFRSAQPLWLNVWTSANEQHPNDKVGYYIGIYVVFAALNLLLMWAEFWVFMIYIVPHSAKILHNKVLVAAMHAPMAYFVATDTGEIVNRFSQDLTLVDMPLPMSFLMSYSQVIGALAQVILTCVASGYLAVAIPFMLGVLFLLQKFYLRTSRQMRLLDLEAKSPLYSYFISSFEGLTALRAYGWTRRAEDENLARLNESQRPYYLLFCIQRWLSLVLDLIVTGLAVLLVGLAVALRDRINPGLLGVALTSVMGIGQTLSMLIQMWTQLETSLGAVTRINQFERDTPKEQDGPDMPPGGGGENDDGEWPTKGAITVRGLHAKYGDRKVLDDINLDIKPGEKVAVCGRSGSGKSTLVMLLLRLYHPESGDIVIDGIDTASLNLNALRESLVALPQDPMFLAGTVRYNLDPLGKVADEETWRALEKTGIKGVIEEKGGLGADLNTDWLSAGQRQLFCLARAMLRRSKVLLLDEATSSLDRQTEAFVDELIRTEFRDWTCIVVAHRLKTVVDFDKVLVLQDGKMVEFDSPKSLLERESMFKTLWDLQEK
ncbi:P-loop containing nucleoside triphosphate hydrolase protein [Diplogelasinospora grovesii]|uniref:P-loop containing nucleoside triphosphate hydrolase protein n=1 Tax=Diplogelasinospora grovesii TaxID=303347 RepID=A0AAN6MYB1_9PEZI|nr:P-loop containing nucleoside triphosphate hydrolase protein [Diplogelasinospora grovesii]